jgi:hypothetical protein
MSHLEAKWLMLSRYSTSVYFSYKEMLAYFYQAGGIPMDRITEKERVSALYRAGFTTREIKRLCRVRRTSLENEQDQAPTNLHHLQFVRWLVKNGKLTDL